MNQDITPMRPQKVCSTLHTASSNEAIEINPLSAPSIKQNSHSEEQINQNILHTEAYALLTIAQVAKHLQVSRAHVYKLMRQGLPTIHLGRSVRINIVSLNRWLSEQETYE